MNITRRKFSLGASALAVSAALGGSFATTLVEVAFAQSAELLTRAGPLGDMVLGDEKAPVTIIEYASMTCPACAAFHNNTYPELKKRYIDTGKVRFILREFPIDPLATATFMLARCSGPDRYFAMIEILFEKQDAWRVRQPLPPLLAIARQAGFTEQTFNECLQNKKIQEHVEDVRLRAIKLGVQSTPTFFINGNQVRAFTIDDFDRALSGYLKD